MTSALPLDPIHGGQLHPIAQRFGIPASKLLDFSANINPEGPPPAVTASLRASLDDLSVLTSYPEIEEGALKRSIARYAGIRPANIAVANGFVPLLEAALRALPIRRCLLPVPAFAEYRKALARAHVEVTPLALTAESGFRYEGFHYEDFHYELGALVTGGQDAILLANPQNPSGIACSRKTLLSLAASAAERNIYLLLDEAFIDYLPGDSLTRDVDRFPNLVVFRSVTKFFGIPGLRVAYTAAHPEITRLLNESLPPWLITTLASRAVCAACEDEAYANRTRLLNRRRRAHFKDGLEALGIHAYPSAANFLLFRLPSPVDPIVFWERMIVEHHIVLRSCANYEALAPGHLRAAVRNERENARMLDAVARLLVPENRPITRRRFAGALLLAAITTRLPAQDRPQRIVSTAPSSTEELFALGLGDRVVGVSRFCDFPPEVRKLPKVGTYTNPDPEAIARLAPDLVILQQNSSELTDRLNALHIRFVEVPHNSLNDVFTGIQSIASAAGVEERAAGVIDRIKSGLAATHAKAAASPSVRVLVIVDRKQGTLTDLVAVGPNNYVNQIVEIAGGINVLAKPGLPQYPHISLETVLREDPDAIVDLSGTQSSDTARRASSASTLSLWRQETSLTAVRRGNVYAGTSNSLVVPGPRTPEAAQELFNAMHGIENAAEMGGRG